MYSLLTVLLIQYTAQLQQLRGSLNDTGQILSINEYHKIKICYYRRYLWAAWKPYVQELAATQHIMGTTDRSMNSKHSNNMYKQDTMCTELLEILCTQES